MYHSVDTEIAEIVGVNAAIIFNNISFWVLKNEANEENFYDGYYWTHNSRAAYRILFPYMTEKQIRGAIQRLVVEGMIKTGCYNTQPFDRTLWYTLTEKGRAMCCVKSTSPERPTEQPSKSAPLAPEGQPIPYINTDIKPDIYNPPISPLTEQGKKDKATIPPSIEDVKTYCEERANGIDPKEWYDFYASKGWMIGKNKMVDWKAAVRTWENRSNAHERAAPQNGGKTSYFMNYTQRKYTDAELDSMGIGVDLLGEGKE